MARQTNLRLTSNDKIALSLSGGGFRATLFHLGLVRCLQEHGMLTRVTDICSVSGGSILAAHLVCRWGDYTSSNLRQFDDAAEELIDFVRSDVRGSLLRRWAFYWWLAWLRFFRIEYFGRTQILKRLYDRLYQGDNRLLGKLSSPPRLHLLCTSMTTGALCAFSQKGFWRRYHDGVEQKIDHESIPTSFAVAASSAFPPLFPPIRLTREALVASEREFGKEELLTDGGVYDNLGLFKALHLAKQSNQFRWILNSDAERAFDSQGDHSFSLITSRTARSSEILMTKNSELEYSRAASDSTTVVTCKMREVIDSSIDPHAIDPAKQRAIMTTRTDLDEFSWDEIRGLTHHGYAVCQANLIRLGIIPPYCVTPWVPPCVPDANKPHQEWELEHASKRKLRGLLRAEDKFTWMLALQACLVACLIAVPFLTDRIRIGTLTQQQQESLSASVEAFREKRQTEYDANVARTSSRIRSRVRPIRPGISIGLANERGDTGTLCCIARKPNSDSHYLLSTRHLFVPTNVDAAAGGPAVIIQPGKLDGGTVADSIAKVASLEQFNSQVDAFLAEIQEGTPWSAEVAGFGPITGIAQEVPLGANLLLIGRTTGVTQATVESITALDHSVTDSDLGGFGVNADELIIARRPLIAPAIRQLPTPSDMYAGNSGSPALTEDGKLAGMLVGSLKSDSTIAIILPIERVIETLGVEVVIGRRSSFDKQPLIGSLDSDHGDLAWTSSAHAVDGEQKWDYEFKITNRDPNRRCRIVCKSLDVAVFIEPGDRYTHLSTSNSRPKIIEAELSVNGGRFIQDKPVPIQIWSPTVNSRGPN